MKQGSADRDFGVRYNKVLELINNRIEEDEYAVQLNAKIDILEIEEFEKEEEVSLPYSFKKFLARYNGGFLCSDSWAEYIWETGRTSLPESKSTIIYSLDRIKKEYDKFVKYANENYGGYMFPFDMIPFAETESGSYFVFKSLEEGETESQVFETPYGVCHDTNGVVFNDFFDFMINYIENQGDFNCF